MDLASDEYRQQELEGGGWTIARIPVAVILHHPAEFVRRVETALQGLLQGSRTRTRT